MVIICIDNKKIWRKITNKQIILSKGANGRGLIVSKIKDIINKSNMKFEFVYIKIRDDIND